MLTFHLATRAPSPSAPPVAAEPAPRAAAAVVEELPPLMLDSFPAADGGGVDVVYLRRVVERVRVDECYRLAADEHGRPAAVPVRFDLTADERM